MKEPSTIVGTSSNPGVQMAVAAAAAAAATGGPVAAVVATMLQSLFTGAAGAAITKNIEAAVIALDEELSALKDEQSKMTAQQILVAHQAVREMVVSIDQTRLDTLRRVAIGAVKDSDLSENDAYVIARVLRDVTPGEINFLNQYFRYSQIYLLQQSFGGELNPATRDEIVTEGGYILDEANGEVQLIEGLVRTGLMKRSDRVAEAYEFTSVVAKILAYLTR